MLKRGIELANDTRVATLPSLPIFRAFGRHRCKGDEASARTLGCLKRFIIAARAPMNTMAACTPFRCRRTRALSGSFR